jgi:hypothetical protein
VPLSQEQGLFDALDKVPFCMEFLTYAVRPDRKERLAWDFYILVLVIYSSITGPYTAAFVGDQEMSFFEILCDFSFYVDMVFSFWTGFDKGFEVVMEKKAIVKNYLFGWFFIDFIATINWDIVIAAIGHSNTDSPLIRMMRLLKVLRLARAGRLINRLTSSWTLHTAYIEAAKFFFYVFMVGHLLACFFYMWPTLMDCPRSDVSVPIEMPGVFKPDLVEGVPYVEHVDNPDWQAVFDTISLGDDGLASGEGWYYHLTCMQGSWRQGYGLEQICSVMDTQGNMRPEPFDTQEERDVLKECYVAAARDSKHVVRREGGFVKPIREVCVPCMSARRLYVDAIYWSLTTMTTIGYGDRGPVTEDEIVFVIFAEVFGLCIFALLLTQINTLGEVVGETEAKKNDEKNGVVQFLKNQHLSEGLVEEAVRFLNFRASSLSGHAFTADADEFKMLSPGLIESIQNAVYRPVLERVRFFGWNEEDRLENEQVKKMFDDIDTDGGGSLDKAETSALFKKLQIDLTDVQYDQVFHELDRGDSGDISFEEFQRWWFLKKNGKPRMNRCPSPFLDALCTKLSTSPFAIREEMVHPGDYGKSLIIILSGSVKVYRDIEQYPVSLPDSERPEIMSEVVAADDREPIVGFASCLSTSQWKKVTNRTEDWVVHAQSYVDTAWVQRQDIIECFETTWPDGQAEMVEVAKFHYEIDVQSQDFNQLGSSDAASSLEELGPDLVELDGDLSERIDTLNSELCNRIASIEKKVDTKLDSILELLQSS